MRAYMRLYLWFAGTTGLALTEKTRQLMSPTPVKHEYEIADALEKWSEQERTLRAHGDEYKLSAAFKVTALRELMTCKTEQFESWKGRQSPSTTRRSTMPCSMTSTPKSGSKHSKEG